MKEKCLVVDGNNLLYSSYYVAQKFPWKMKKGTIFFFLRVLISVFKKGNYHKLLIAFDGGGTNWRKILAPQYKLQRVKMPDELWEQMEELKSLLEKSNVHYIQLINQEADDLIASFVKKTITTYPNVVFDIFTRDKDLLQLLNNNTNIIKYINGKNSLYTYEDFLKEYNYNPINYVDYLSLLGDDVDNIKGVKGIGPVNAKKLIQQFQTVENIYQAIDQIPENIKQLLKNNQEIAFGNKRIISLETNISLPLEIYNKWTFDWEKWKKNEKIREFCLENSFNSIIKLLN